MSLQQVLIHIAILMTVFMVGCASQPSYSTIETPDGEFEVLQTGQQAEYQKNNPHWQSVVCDCGHFIQDENPTLFIENVHSFMSTLTPNP